MGIGELTISVILGHAGGGRGKSTTRGYIHGVDAIARREATRVANAIANYLNGETNVVPMRADGGAGE